MARPKKPINWDVVEKRMEAGCSAKEIAASIPVEINTFYDRFKEEFGCGFGDFADTFCSAGDGNLRYTQYMKALSGNLNMLMFLGKERLGQGKDEVMKSPYEETLELRHENMILRNRLANLDKDADKSQTG